MVPQFSYCWVLPELSLAQCKGRSVFRKSYCQKRLHLQTTGLHHDRPHITLRALNPASPPSPLASSPSLPLSYPALPCPALTLPCPPPLTPHLGRLSQTTPISAADMSVIASSYAVTIASSNALLQSSVLTPCAQAVSSTSSTVNTTELDLQVRKRGGLCVVYG